jgi:uncharacterized protein YkwD
MGREEQTMARHGKLLHVLIVAVVVASGVFASALAAPALPGAGGDVAAAGYNPGGEECKFLTLINRYRASKHEGKLALSRPLGEAAEDHTRDMARRKKMYHTPDLLDTLRKKYGYDGTRVGENVAAGFNSADSVMKAWQKSADHNRNMLDGRFEAIGIAEVNGYWTTDFGNQTDHTVRC